MENFTPWSALAGGALIGLAAALYLFFLGRVTGISGILAGLIKPAKSEWPIQLAFIIGLIAAPFAVRWFSGSTISITVTQSIPILVIAGVLVGYGTRLGGGCTSGHGICGNARLSPRSIAATVLFVLAGMATVYVTKRVIGL